MDMGLAIRKSGLGLTVLAGILAFCAGIQVPASTVGIGSPSAPAAQGLTASFSFSPAAPRPGQTVSFTDTSAGTPTAWAWTFGDGGTSTQKNPDHIYSRNGVWPVTLTVTQGTKTAAATRFVTVKDVACSLILGNPAPQSVVASILSDVVLEGYLEYGSSPGSYTLQTAQVSMGAGTPAAITMDRLPTDSTVYYRFRYRTPGNTEYLAWEEASFHTPRAPGSAFTFTVQADPHVGDTGFVPDLYLRTLSNILAVQPDFHLDLGDTFLTEKLAQTEQEEVATFAAHRPYFGVTGPSAPLFLVNGNHEGELGWEKDGTANCLAVRSTLDRRTWYPCPVPGSFYSGSAVPEPWVGVRDSYCAWTWGDALFIVLDPFWYTTGKPNGTTIDNWGWTLGKAQYDWLKTTLETSTARFRFVFIHHLVGGLDSEARGGAEAATLYEWGGHNRDGSDGFAANRPGWAMPIHDLLKANGVNIVFHGHDHFFAKQVVDGIVYQECPRPSFNQANVSADATAAGYLSGDILASPGHLRVQVSSSSVTVDYIRSSLTDPGNNATVACTYTLSPSSGKPTASFSFLPSGPEAGQSIQFRDGSTGNPSSWSWNFGDGGISSLQNPVHIYPSGGNYTVSLTVTNAAGSDTASRPVTVKEAGSGAFPGNVVLGCPTDSSVRANLYSAGVGGDLYLEYGTATAPFSSRTPQTALVAGTPLAISLQDLSPDTAYGYRVCFRPTGASSFTAGTESWFHTARPPGSTFTFCVQGDSHPERERTQFDADLYSRTLLTAGADHPDFYLAMGDDFSVDTLDPATINEALVTARYAIQRPYLGLIGCSAPVFLVNGNHEQAARYLLDGTPANIAVWAQSARNRFYSQPAPDGFYTGNTETVPYIGLLRNYFAWTWGDALFVTIDPYWSSPDCVDEPFGGGPKRTDLWDITHGDAQYQWLKNTLERSRARYKFVFAHHVLGTGRGGAELAGLYEWGGQNGNGTWGFATRRPAWEMPIHQLMVATGVTIFFQGHDHIWVRQVKDGVIYQTLPEPADPNYSLYNADAFYSPDKYPNTGYTRVTVSPSGGRMDYVRTWLPKDEGTGRVNGTVAFSCTFLPTGTATALCGDLDGSGEVNSTDLLLMANCLAESLPMEVSALPWADLDRSGSLNVLDLVILQGYLSRQISSLDCSGRK